jgi:hypothetical protein
MPLTVRVEGPDAEAITKRFKEACVQGSRQCAEAHGWLPAERAVGALAFSEGFLAGVEWVATEQKR